MAELTTLAVRHAGGLQTPTAIPRLTIWFSPQRTHPTPAMFDPKVYLLVQGAKRLSFGKRSVDYSSGSYAVSSVGLPFTGQVLEASPESPYIGIELKLDGAAIASLLLDMPEDRATDVTAITIAHAASDIANDVTEPLYRLVRLLDSPKEDVAVLAPLIERELYYRLLQGPMGRTIRQVVQVNTRLWEVRKAVEWICGNAAAPLRVGQLAKSAGMSVTSFHRRFKAVTALSPLAYQKHVRLLEARRLLTLDATNVTSVAFAVGYASSSQFSREYTRMFGLSPMRDIARIREPACK